MKAVIAAAGVGSRLLPVTAGIPKCLLPILNKPIIHYLVEQCAAAGVKEIIIVTNRDGYLIQKYFSSKEEALNILETKGIKNGVGKFWKIPDDIQFVYIRQNIKLPRGNAAALYSAKHLIDDEPFLYLFEDVYIIGDHAGVEEILKKYEQDPCDGLMTGKKCSKEEISKKGIVKIKQGTEDEIETIIEKPSLEEAPSDIGTNAPYIFTPKLFKYLDPKNINEKVGEFVFQDAVEAMIEDGGKVKVNLTKGIYLSNGDPLSYLKAVVEQGLFDDSLRKDVRKFLEEKCRDFKDEQKNF